MVKYISLISFCLIIWTNCIGQSSDSTNQELLIVPNTLIQDTITKIQDSMVQPFFSSYVTCMVKIVVYKESIINKTSSTRTIRTRPNLKDLYSFDVITLSTLVNTCAGVQYLHCKDFGP